MSTFYLKIQKSDKGVILISSSEDVTIFFIISVLANIILFLIQAKKLYTLKDSKGLSLISYIPIQLEGTGFIV